MAVDDKSAVKAAIKNDKNSTPFPNPFKPLSRKFWRNIKPPKTGLKNTQKPNTAHLEYIAIGSGVLSVSSIYLFVYNYTSVRTEP
jgi:hypothetical protein